MLRTKFQNSKTHSYPERYDNKDFYKQDKEYTNSIMRYSNGETEFVVLERYRDEVIAILMKKVFDRHKEIRPMCTNCKRIMKK